jgi:hypothetical protein
VVAKASYMVVKIKPQWVVTAGKQTNKQTAFPLLKGPFNIVTPLTFSCCTPNQVAGFRTQSNSDYRQPPDKVVNHQMTFTFHLEFKSKGKGHPRTGHEGPEGV